MQRADVSLADDDQLLESLPRHLDVSDFLAEDERLDDFDFGGQLAADKAGDLLADAHVAAELLAEVSLVQIHLDDLGIDDKPAAAGVFFKPHDPWPQPGLVVLDRDWLQAGAAHL